MPEIILSSRKQNKNKLFVFTEEHFFFELEIVIQIGKKLLKIAIHTWPLLPAIFEKRNYVLEPSKQ